MEPTAPGVDTGAMMVDVGLRAASETLVGRVAEMSLLGRAMDSALVDGSAIVVIAGEAGVGKTRLVQELAAEAGQRHFRVGMGRCIDLGETIWPLAPLRDLVGGLIDELDAEALDLVLGSARAALSGLVPELGNVASDAAPLTSEQLCELIVGMFVRLTQRGPLLFVVEDLHWADPTTRMLFTALAGVARIRPLLLVGTFRSDELHRRHPLRPTLAEIERSPRCQRMSLEPLDQWETALLIDALDPTASERAYAEVVHHRSGGNPFFVEELVAARRTGVETVPETLRDVILARAAVLDDRDMAVLGAAAAAGETSAEVLAAATGLQAGELDAVLARLRAGAQLARTDRVRFRHELAREVFYDELLPGERTRLHADLARSLEAHSPDRLGEIAHHWRAAHDGGRALPAHVAAGRQALFSRSTIGLSFGDPYVLSIGMTILADAACGDRHHPASAAPEARALATAWTACVDASYAATEHLTPLDQLHREQAELQADRLGGHAHPDRWMRLADGWSGLGYRYEEAAARLRAADHHLAGPPGRSPTARRAATEQLARAHDLASDLPTPPLLARIDDLARRAHLSVGGARAPATDGLGLTRREYDVLCLVAEGRSNGQIARELFISTKTASVHVSNILRKLGVTNRREAADYARLHGVGR
jgi:DNA-binding CsgD family transcriptional regulator